MESGRLCAGRDIVRTIEHTDSHAFAFFDLLLGDGFARLAAGSNGSAAALFRFFVGLAADLVPARCFVSFAGCCFCGGCFCFCCFGALELELELEVDLAAVDVAGAFLVFFVPFGFPLLDSWLGHWHILVSLDLRQLAHVGCFSSHLIRFSRQVRHPVLERDRFCVVLSPLDVGCSSNAPYCG